MTIRPATERDLGRIAEIQAASPEAAAWNAPSYLAYRCLVVEEAENAAGFLAAREITAGEYELLNLAIDPPARRRGLAKALLNYALSTWAGTWFLEVRESNSGALALYEKAGFRACGRRPAYYSAPEEAGIVMKFVS